MLVISQKKTDYNARILDTESKYFIIADYNNCTTQTLDAKIKQKELVDKFSIDGFIKNAVLNKKSSNISNKCRIKSRAR